jgi:hypothetical protein
MGCSKLIKVTLISVRDLSNENRRCTVEGTSPPGKLLQGQHTDTTLIHVDEAEQQYPTLPDRTTPYELGIQIPKLNNSVSDQS